MDSALPSVAFLYKTKISISLPLSNFKLCGPVHFYEILVTS